MTSAYEERALKRQRLREPASVFKLPLVVYVAVTLFYLSYRYPLQINAVGTSPTYSDTPLALQLGKYALLAICVGWMVAVSPPPRYDQPVSQVSAFVPSLALLALFALAKSAMDGSADGLAAALPLVLSTVVALLCRRGLDAAAIGQVLKVFAVLALLMEGVELALYQFYGRLPALAYPGGSVRFGAILDDPNDWGLMTALLLPLILIGVRRLFVRLVLMAAAVVSLVLTESFTSIVAVSFAILITIAVLLIRAPEIRLGVISLAGVGYIVAGNFAESSELVQGVIASKAGSFEAHAGSIAALSQFSPAAWFGFEAPTASFESSYVNLIANFGVLFAAGYIAIGVAASVLLARRFRAAEDRRLKAVYAAFFAYVVAFLVASVNLQLEGAFPANALYWLSVILAASPHVAALPLAARRWSVSPPRQHSAQPRQVSANRRR